MKTALVTSANKSIGFGVVKQLLDLGSLNMPKLMKRDQQGVFQ